MSDNKIIVPVKPATPIKPTSRNTQATSIREGSTAIGHIPPIPRPPKK